jgi:hypothetical protein
MSESPLQHPVLDPIAVCLTWISIHWVIDLFVLNVLVPDRFTIMGLTGIAGGLSLLVSLIYLHVRAS